MRALLLSLSLGVRLWATPDFAGELRTRRFSCQNYSDARMLHCQGRVEGYARPVHLLVPIALKPKPALLYYFHGFWLDEGTNPFAGARGNFAASLSETEQNVIGIIAESRAQNYDYRNQFDSSDKLNLFVERVELLLKRSGADVGADNLRLLAGHSGAYVMLGQVGSWMRAGELPALTSVIGFALLDSAYDYRPGLVEAIGAMCGAHKGITYFQAFNPADGQLKKRRTNERIRAEVRGACPRANVVYLPTPDLLHMDFPRQFLGRFVQAALGDPDLFTRVERISNGRRPAGGLQTKAK